MFYTIVPMCLKIVEILYDETSDLGRIYTVTHLFVCLSKFFIAFYNFQFCFYHSSHLEKRECHDASLVLLKLKTWVKVFFSRVIYLGRVKQSTLKILKHSPDLKKLH